MFEPALLETIPICIIYEATQNITLYLYKTKAKFFINP